MIVVFDLDDTLYEEMSFVRSGFQAVADYLEQAFSISPTESLTFMLDSLKGGRGRIFDDLLLHFDLYSKQKVKKCLSIYRSHKPKIHLYLEAEECLKKFAHLPLYIVTDGNKLVQQNKLGALGIKDKVKFSFVTHCYGIKNAKPSPYCFLKIAEKEEISPKDIVYIADNPHKDFVGIKPLGFKTIRLFQGPYKDIKLSEEFEAEFAINSLSELTEDYLKIIQEVSFKWNRYV